MCQMQNPCRALRGWGIMRQISSELNRCLLSYRGREPIDLEIARAQHQTFRELLEDLGLEITIIPELDNHPDCCFVEDTAVLLGSNTAVICSMGNPARRGEEQAVAALLEKRGLHLVRMAGDARADGGDVLIINNEVFVGLSNRTNAEGFKVIAAAAEPEGIEAHAVRIRGALHLKSVVTRLGKSSVLGLKRHIGEGLGFLERYDWLTPPAGEEAAANAVTLGDTVVVSSTNRELARLIERRGFKVASVDISELQKAEAGLTCLAILKSES